MANTESNVRLRSEATYTGKRVRALQRKVVDPDTGDTIEVEEQAVQVVGANGLPVDFGEIRDLLQTLVREAQLIRLSLQALGAPDVTDSDNET